MNIKLSTKKINWAKTEKLTFLTSSRGCLLVYRKNNGNERFIYFVSNAIRTNQLYLPYLNGASRIHSDASSNIIQIRTFSLPDPRNYKRRFVKNKKGSFFASHNEVLFSFFRFWTYASRSLFELHQVPFSQVCFSFLDDLIELYIISDPWLLPEILFINHNHFSNNSCKKIY